MDGATDDSGSNLRKGIIYASEKLRGKNNSFLPVQEGSLLV